MNIVTVPMLSVALTFSAVGVLFGARPAAATESIAVGQPFPDLPLVDLDGVPKRVSDFRGTKLVLHVFASW